MEARSTNHPERPRHTSISQRLGELSSRSSTNTGSHQPTLSLENARNRCERVHRKMSVMLPSEASSGVLQTRNETSTHLRVGLSTSWRGYKKQKTVISTYSYV